mmetsp:Transcript_17130/g.23542  ORF Transcript_17130/g.23542 Transcript_17130/m.23542 type:complete len:162 (-) Transcript_17130:228-713(-)
MNELRRRRNQGGIYEAERAALIPPSSTDGGNDLRGNRNPSSATSRGKGNAQKSSSSASLSTAQEARNITESLRHTKNMMSQELERVSNLHTVIEEDDKHLSEAKDDHMDMGGAVKGARGALRKLGRQDVQEAVILRCAVFFFYSVAFYVFWSRVRIPFLLW